MAITVTWQGGNGVTTINSGSYMGFFGNTFGSSIIPTHYQDFTCVTDVHMITNSGSLPNVKKGSTINSYMSGGISERMLSDISSVECTVRITVNSTSLLALQSMQLIAYNGISTASGPTGCIVYGAERGNTVWTPMSGSSYPLYLAAQYGDSNIWTYYIALSVTPTIAGINPNIKFILYGESY